MADQPSDPHEGEPFPIDLSIARLARVENFFAGGDAHFAVDRAAAESIAEVSPGGADGLRTMIDALKAFVARAVTALASEAGVVQFLHIGMATPTTGMVHHIASKIAPESRVVYVSWDPTTLAHVHSLGKDTGQVAVAHLQCSFDDPATILRGAAATLDFERPVAVILPTTLTLVPDDDTAQRILDELGAGIAPGSYLVFAHNNMSAMNGGLTKVDHLFTFNIVDSIKGLALVRDGTLLDAITYTSTTQGNIAARYISIIAAQPRTLPCSRLMLRIGRSALQAALGHQRRCSRSS